MPHEVQPLYNHMHDEYLEWLAREILSHVLHAVPDREDIEYLVRQQLLHRF